MQFRFRGKRLRIPVPTPTAWKAYLVLAALSLGSLFFPLLQAAWEAFLAALLLWLLLSLAVRPGPEAVAVERLVPPRLYVGRTGVCELTIISRARVALQVRIRDIFDPQLGERNQFVWTLSLGPFENKRLREDLLPLERGPCVLGPTGLSVWFGWSLLAFTQTVDTRKEVAVLPGRPSGETEQLLARASLLTEIGEHQLKLRGHDQEFDCLSDYVTGDDVRRIDWKASARRMKPQVRRYHLERNAELLLAIDTGRLMGSLVGGIRKLDLAVTPLLDLAAVALKRGERVGLVAFSSKVEAYIAPRRGVSNLLRFQEALAGLEPRYDYTSFESFAVFLKERHRRRALVVLFTDFADELSSQAVLRTISVLSKRHFVLFCRVTDPHIEEIFRSRADTVAAVFQKAVAADLLTEGRRLITELRRLGAYVVAGPPERLSPRVLRGYLEVRIRGLV